MSYWRVSRPWLLVEIDADWRRLIGPVRCRVFGHATVDVLGDCVRCRADLVGLSPDERLRIAQREINKHLAQHYEILTRGA